MNDSQIENLNNQIRNLNAELADTIKKRDQAYDNYKRANDAANADVRTIEASQKQLSDAEKALNSAQYEYSQAVREKNAKQRQVDGIVIQPTPEMETRIANAKKDLESAQKNFDENQEAINTLPDKIENGKQRVEEDKKKVEEAQNGLNNCLLYTSPSPRD